MVVTIIPYTRMILTAMGTWCRVGGGQQPVMYVEIRRGTILFCAHSHKAITEDRKQIDCLIAAICLGSTRARTQTLGAPVEQRFIMLANRIQGQEVFEAGYTGKSTVEGGRQNAAAHSSGYRTSAHRSGRGLECTPGVRGCDPTETGTVSRTVGPVLHSCQTPWGWGCG